MATFRATFESNMNDTLNAVMDKNTSGTLRAEFGEVQKVSTSDYRELSNKPSINGVTVTGDKTGADYRLQGLIDMATENDIDNIIYGG